SRESGWDVAHDEIAAAAVSIGDAVALQHVHEALAYGMLSGGDRSPETLVRAFRHQVSADVQVPGWIVQRVVLSARARGDMRTLRVVLEEVLRGVADSAGVERVLQGAPLRLRQESAVKWVGIAAGFVVAVGLGISISSQVRTSNGTLSAVDQPPSKMLIALANDSTIYTVDLSASSWQSGKPIEISAVPKSKFLFDASKLSLVSSSGVNQRGERLLLGGNSQDIFILESGGKKQEIAKDSSDNVQAMWASDGRSVLFSSRRWDRKDAHLEIAYRDVVTGSIVRLTNSNANKYLGAISPDGSRFTYTEDLLEEKRTRLCWKNMPGMSARGECIEPDSGRLNPMTLVSWTEPGIVLVEVLRLNKQGVQVKALVRMELSTGATTTLVTDAARYFVSPDGRWIVSQHMIENGTSMVVRPVHNPRDARHLMLRSQIVSITSINWNVGAAQFQPVSILRLDDTIHVNLDEPSSVNVVARAANGAVMEGSAAVFTSLDTTIFTIDSMQRIRAKKGGYAKIEARLGTSVARALVKVDTSTSFQVKLRENWSGNLNTNWYLHGQPVPRIAKDKTGQAVLDINGDNNNTSAITSRLTLDGQNGAGVELEIQTPLNDTKWQKIAVTLFADADESAIKRWAPGLDQQPQKWLSDLRKDCGAAYPAEEGTTGVDRLLTIVGSAPQTVEVPQSLSLGRVFRLRVQVLGDGRCQFSLDGKLLPENSGRVKIARTYRVNVAGASLGTTVRVLRLEAWAGVRR
ncbi:MAG: hypothetical protein ABJB66_11135, partial [Gemmatimonadaceae bacterium]